MRSDTCFFGIVLFSPSYLIRHTVGLILSPSSFVLAKSGCFSSCFLVFLKVLVQFSRTQALAARNKDTNRICGRNTFNYDASEIETADGASHSTLIHIFRR
jgi:hypothetical protein